MGVLGTTPQFRLVGGEVVMGIYVRQRESWQKN